MRAILPLLLFPPLLFSQPASPRTYLAGLQQELRRQWPQNRTIHLVFHGHSVPAGYFKTPDVRTFDSYPHLLHRALKRLYPFAVINVFVTARGGENSVSGAARFARDVLSVRPDVVFLDYALNDRRLPPGRSRAAWAGMIRAASRAGAKLILLTPTGDTRAGLNDDADPISKQAEEVRALASEFGVGLADSFAVYRRYLRDHGTIEPLMSQVNHPSRAGHELVALELERYFTGASSSTSCPNAGSERDNAPR